MFCPKCKQHETQVLESRDSNENIRRRRECLTCGYRFTTYERVEACNLQVVKKDGRKERFNPDKITNGINLACKNLSITPERILELTDQVELQIQSLARDTITTEEIGRLVELGLKELDEVAYLRFVSVHQSFSKVSDFAQAIRKLK